MAIVDALNKVTGGHGSTIEEAIKNLSSGGGSDLPEVTSDDNGKVLTVVEGVWNKADASGGSDTTVFVDFETTYDEVEEENLVTSCSMTLDEMIDALKSGKNLVARVDRSADDTEGSGSNKYVQYLALSNYNVYTDGEGIDAKSVSFTLFESSVPNALLYTLSVYEHDGSDHYDFVIKEIALVS